MAEGSHQSAMLWVQLAAAASRAAIHPAAPSRDALETVLGCQYPRSSTSRLDWARAVIGQRTSSSSLTSSGPPPQSDPAAGNARCGAADAVAHEALAAAGAVLFAPWSVQQTPHDTADLGLGPESPLALLQDVKKLHEMVRLRAHPSTSPTSGDEAVPVSKNGVGEAELCSSAYPVLLPSSLTLLCLHSNRVLRVWAMESILLHLSALTSAAHADTHQHGQRAEGSVPRPSEAPGIGAAAAPTAFVVVAELCVLLEHLSDYLTAVLPSTSPRFPPSLWATAFATLCWDLVQFQTALEECCVAAPSLPSTAPPVWALPPEIPPFSLTLLFSARLCHLMFSWCSRPPAAASVVRALGAELEDCTATDRLLLRLRGAREMSAEQRREKFASALIHSAILHAKIVTTLLTEPAASMPLGLRFRVAVEGEPSLACASDVDAELSGAWRRLELLWALSSWLLPLTSKSSASAGPTSSNAAVTATTLRDNVLKLTLTNLLKQLDMPKIVSEGSALAAVTAGASSSEVLTAVNSARIATWKLSASFLALCVSVVLATYRHSGERNADDAASSPLDSAAWQAAVLHFHNSRLTSLWALAQLSARLGISTSGPAAPTALVHQLVFVDAAAAFRCSSHSTLRANGAMWKELPAVLHACLHLRRDAEAALALLAALLSAVFGAARRRSGGCGGDSQWDLQCLLLEDAVAASRSPVSELLVSCLTQITAHLSAALPLVLSFVVSRLRAADGGGGPARKGDYGTASAGNATRWALSQRLLFGEGNRTRSELPHPNADVHLLNRLGCLGALLERAADTTLRMLGQLIVGQIFGHPSVVQAAPVTPQMSTAAPSTRCEEDGGDTGGNAHLTAASDNASAVLLLLQREAWARDSCCILWCSVVLRQFMTVVLATRAAPRRSAQDRNAAANTTAEADAVEPSFAAHRARAAASAEVLAFVRRHASHLISLASELMDSEGTAFLHCLGGEDELHGTALLLQFLVGASSGTIPSKARTDLLDTVCRFYRAVEKIVLQLPRPPQGSQRTSKQQDEVKNKKTLSTTTSAPLVFDAMAPYIAATFTSVLSKASVFDTAPLVRLLLTLAQASVGHSATMLKLLSASGESSPSSGTTAAPPRLRRDVVIAFHGCWAQLPATDRMVLKRAAHEEHPWLKALIGSVGAAAQQAESERDKLMAQYDREDAQQRRLDDLNRTQDAADALAREGHRKREREERDAAARLGLRSAQAGPDNGVYSNRNATAGPHSPLSSDSGNSAASKKRRVDLSAAAECGEDEHRSTLVSPVDIANPQAARTTQKRSAQHPDAEVLPAPPTHLHLTADAAAGGGSSSRSDVSSTLERFSGVLRQFAHVSAQPQNLLGAEFSVLPPSDGAKLPQPLPRQPQQPAPRVGESATTGPVAPHRVAAAGGSAAAPPSKNDTDGAPLKMMIANERKKSKPEAATSKALALCLLRAVLLQTNTAAAIAGAASHHNRYDPGEEAPLHDQRDGVVTDDICAAAAAATAAVGAVKRDRGSSEAAPVATQQQRLQSGEDASALFPSSALRSIPSAVWTSAAAPDSSCDAVVGWKHEKDYPQTFLPWLALELRHDLCSSIRDVAEEWRRTSQQRGPIPALTATGALRMQMVRLDTGVQPLPLGSDSGYSSNGGRSLELVRLVLESQPDDGTRENISAVATAPLSTLLNEDDVLLLVFPKLSSVQALANAAAAGHSSSSLSSSQKEPVVGGTGGSKKRMSLDEYVTVLAQVTSLSSQARTVTVDVAQSQAAAVALQDWLKKEAKPATSRSSRVSRLDVYGYRLSGSHMSLYSLQVTALHDLLFTSFRNVLLCPSHEVAEYGKFLKPVVAITGSGATPQDSLNEYQRAAVRAALHQYFSQRPAQEMTFGGGTGSSSNHNNNNGGGVSSDAKSQPSIRLEKEAYVPESTKARFVLIEGPPGTGKTQTIHSIVAAVLREGAVNQSVLVCAPSNTAVDEVLLRLRASGVVGRDGRRTMPRLLRVGVRESVHPDVLAATPPIFIDDQVAASLAQSAANSASGSGDGLSSAALRSKARDVVFAEAQVVCVTFGSLRQVLQRGRTHDFVIVDEASQATEPQTLMALTAGCRRCVLVGDVKQLQPTVLSLRAARNGLAQSLMARLVAAGLPTVRLRMQYRMVSPISAFSNREFYRGDLVDAPFLRDANTAASLRPSAAPLVPLLLPPDAARLPRFLLLNVDDGVMATGASDGRSRSNAREAYVLMQHQRYLRERLGLSIVDYGKRIGIITYYKAQQRVLRRLLTDEEQRHITVDTVDGFQGKERDIIFISCVRAPFHHQRRRAAKATAIEGEIDSMAQSQSSGTLPTGGSTSRTPAAGAGASASHDLLGFTADRHRMNVSLTRAREFLVVVGHAETLLQGGGAWRRLVEYASQKNDFTLFQSHVELVDVVGDCNAFADKASPS